MSDLEAIYIKKKIELCEDAERAVLESNIPEGLVKDYILAMILMEKTRLDGSLHMQAPVTKEKYQGKVWPKEEAQKLFQGYLEAGFSQDDAYDKLVKMRIIERGTVFDLGGDDGKEN